MESSQSSARPTGTGTTGISQTEEGQLRAKESRKQNASPSQSSTKGFIATSDVYVVGEKRGVVASTRNMGGIGNARNTSTVKTTSENPSRKRTHASIAVTDLPATNRNANDTHDVEIRPAKNFAKFVDYNFSAMTDTKGGFLSTDDEPWKGGDKGTNGSGGGPEKPAHMTLAEWERMQTIRSLKRLKQGPYEPGLSVLAEAAEQKRCRECNSLEIDFVWDEVFDCRVCNSCKEKYPEKYSLLTKTECREDYLLTDPELKDAELLPHLSRPNPHKSHWHDMMLFLRYQVEDYAIQTKWGSAEKLDAEFERRETDKKRRKEAKFKEKLIQLKKKTRTDAYRRNNAKNDAHGVKATTFGDAVGSQGRHVHDWGRAVENEDGMSVKRCLSCGMEVEELEF